MANVIKNHTLFPTVINEFEYIAEQKLIDAIREEEIKNNDKNFSKQSVDNNLMNKKEYENLKNKILQTTKEVCKFYSYKYEKIDITNSWINFSSKNCFHNPHTHSNNIFSGVWFPFKNTSRTPIIFIDPRQCASVLLPECNDKNIYNTSLSSFPPNMSRGYIFPSWLMHYVPPSLADRISLSWNVLLRGNYGNPNELQNAHI
tara:strand:+ start:167 stop:772 length:606 start_codon:yes stop_codon:yes gene_type:complete